MLYYFLLMLLMNLQIKLRNSLVMYVSVIQFSLFSANFIVIFQAVAKILQIYHESVLMGHHVCVCVCVCEFCLVLI